MIISGFVMVLTSIATAQESLELTTLVEKSACHYEAVEGLLPQCNISLNSSQRTKYAIQLAKCEFEQAGVGYPGVCTTGSSLECTRELEERPQWWTTYSGNYRLVGQICNEYRLKHETDLLLQFHRNLTSTQQEVYIQLVNSLGLLDLNRVYDEQALDLVVKLTNKANSLDQLFDQVLTKHATSLDAIEELANTKLDVLMSIFTQLSGQLSGVETQVGDISTNLESTTHTSTKLHDSHADLHSVLQTNQQIAVNTSRRLHHWQGWFSRTRKWASRAVRILSCCVTTWLVYNQATLPTRLPWLLVPISWYYPVIVAIPGTIYIAVSILFNKPVYPQPPVHVHQGNLCLY